MLGQQLMPIGSPATLQKHKTSVDILQRTTEELFLLLTLSRVLNADATTSVTDELGPIPFSTKRLILLILCLVP